MTDPKPLSAQSQSSTAVPDLIRRIGQATFRTLFVEIELIRSKDSRRHDESSSKVNATTVASDRQTWVELLKEAVDVLPYCTDDQHGEILRLSSILLLAHLLPNSTGTDFFLLQNARRKDNDDAVFNPEDYVLRMPLEDRLDQTPILSLCSNQHGDDDSALTDPDVDVSFDALLDALALLLEQRHAHGQQVDLIHILAMMIHPYHTPSSIPKFHPMFKKNPAVLKAVRLMENASVGLQFQIHYGHRRRVVELVHWHLVVPQVCDEYAVGFAPLMAGALLHLKLSLQCFAAAARTKQDAHLALSASAHVAAQCRNYRLLLKPEWEFLLHHMVDDPADYNCQGKCHNKACQDDCVGSFTHFSNDRTFTMSDTMDNNSFCPHSARGRLLSDFIARASLSRNDADPLFVALVTTSLAEAIEWQVDHWTVSDQDETSAAKMHSTCLLASLLFAAKRVFQLQSSEPEGDDVDDDDPYITLIRCSINLLRHSDRGIVFEASSLLVRAFSNSQWNKVDRFSDLLFPTLRVCIRENDSSSLIESLVAVASSQSQPFASSLLELVLADIETVKPTDADSKEQEQNEPNVELYRLLSVVSINCPAVVSHKREALALLVDTHELPHECRLHASVSFLHSRLGQYFQDDKDTSNGSVGNLLRATTTTNWDRYKVARHAMMSGNFGVAHDALDLLLKCPLAEGHFLWISVLERVSFAESRLSKQGAMGIPEASVALHSAASYIGHLGSFSPSWRASSSFQLRLLLHRLDFLDLVTVLRQLAREMRLTGKSLSKYTRSTLHLRNAVRGLVVLAKRYGELGRNFGAYFRDSQSYSSLCTLRSLALFMVYTSKVIFPDLISRTINKDFLQAHATDPCHPMTSLMRKLDELLLQNIDAALDPLVRAAAMLEVIDGMLKVPIPFQQDFFAPIPMPAPELAVMSHPPRNLDCALVIETSPSMGFEFMARGRLPAHLLKASNGPIWTVLLWFRVKYAGRLVDDDDNHDNLDEQGIDELAVLDIKLPDLSTLSPASTDVSHGGRFCFVVDCPPLLDEGMYALDVKLGVRAVDGGEFEIPLVVPPTPVRVSRSRSLL